MANVNFLDILGSKKGVKQLAGGVKNIFDIKTAFLKAVPGIKGIEYLMKFLKPIADPLVGLTLAFKEGAQEGIEDFIDDFESIIEDPNIQDYIAAGADQLVAFLNIISQMLTTLITLSEIVKELWGKIPKNIRNAITTIAQPVILSL